MISKINQDKLLNNLKLINNAYKNYYQKIVVQDNKLETLSKTSDCQQDKSENLQQNINQWLQGHNKCKNVSKIYKFKTKDSIMKERIKLTFLLNNARDLTVLLRRRTAKSEHLEDRFNNINKDLDYPQLNYLNLDFNLMIIKEE